MPIFTFVHIQNISSPFPCNLRPSTSVHSFSALLATLPFKPGSRSTSPALRYETAGERSRLLEAPLAVSEIRERSTEAKRQLEIPVGGGEGRGRRGGDGGTEWGRAYAENRRGKALEFAAHLGFSVSAMRSGLSRGESFLSECLAPPAAQADVMVFEEMPEELGLSSSRKRGALTGYE